VEGRATETRYLMPSERSSKTFDSRVSTVELRVFADLNKPPSLLAPFDPNPSRPDGSALSGSTDSIGLTTYSVIAPNGNVSTGRVRSIRTETPQR
jgi:hypothetical protein